MNFNDFYMTLTMCYLLVLEQLVSFEVSSRAFFGLFVEAHRGIWMEFVEIVQFLSLNTVHSDFAQ